VARLLALKLGVPAVDLDSVVEDESGLTIAELFAAEGEDEFRANEERALRRVLDAGAALVACGGGIVLRPANRALLRERFHTVWLEVDPAEAAERVEPERSGRPALADGPLRERLEGLLRARAPWYAEVAAVRVDTAGRSADQVAEEVLRLLAEASAFKDRKVPR